MGDPKSRRATGQGGGGLGQRCISKELQGQGCSGAPQRKPMCVESFSKSSTLE